MKKLLFVHDHLFYKGEGKRYYSGGGLPKDIWDRYIRFFNFIEVIGRGALLNEQMAGLVESTHDNVTFNLLYEVSGGRDYFTKSDIIKSKLRDSILRADTIVIRLPSSIGLYCVDLCIKMKRPYITEVVGCVWDASWNYGSFLGKIMAPFLYIKNRKAVKNSEASIYVTKYFLQKRYPNPGKLTSYASNVKIDNFSSDILHRHLELLAKKDKKIIQLGLIGNLEVKYKGFDTAIKALQIVKNKTSVDFRLYLVGGGSDDFVKQLIKKYGLEKEVQIIGRLQSGAEIFNFLDTLDFYIHPSKQEGLPRSVIEAMGRGCPVLASSVAGIPELLDNKYLHMPGEYKKLAKQLLFYVNNTSELVEMSRKNFEISKEYTNDVLTKRRDEFWGKVSEIS